MATLPPSARALLESAPLAHVVTINPDGSPQVSGTWIALAGDALVIAVMGENQKVKNLLRDPRIVLSFEASERNEMGMHQYLVIHGTARIEQGGAPALMGEMAKRYIGPEAVFPSMPNPPAGYRIVITVDRIGGAGPWAAESGG